MRIKLSTLKKIIRECAGDDMPNDDMHSAPLERNLDYQVPSEGKHAKSHLFHTSQDAMSLHDILKDEDNIPTWCLEYLAIARHGLGVVHDYLSYKVNTTK
jgi:hypothetical protein